MVLKIMDKNKGLMTVRSTPQGFVVTKGKRVLYLQGRSINQSKKAKELLAKNSFNRLFNRGKKMRLLSNSSFIAIK